MVTLLLDQTRLEIVLSPTERALAFRRESLKIERQAIRRVQLTDEPWTWLRGIRTVGTHLPGALAMGTWRASKGTDFVLLNGRKRHGVVIELHGGEAFSRVILSTRHGLALVQALRLDEVPEVADVAQLAGAAAPRKPATKKAPSGDPAPAKKPAPKRSPAARPAPAS